MSERTPKRGVCDHCHEKRVIRPESYGLCRQCASDSLLPCPSCGVMTMGTRRWKALDPETRVKYMAEGTHRLRRVGKCEGCYRSSTGRRRRWLPSDLALPEGEWVLHPTRRVLVFKPTDKERRPT